MQNLKPLTSLYSWADQFESYLVRNPEHRFSRDEARMELKVASDKEAFLWPLWVAVLLKVYGVLYIYSISPI